MRQLQLHRCIHLNWVLGVLLVVGSFLFLSCEGNNDAERLAALDSEISAMIADASCNDLADCRVIAYGAKPCGGPWTYLIYCVSAVDSTRLVSLVSMHYELERAINLEEGLLSDCSVPTPPHLGIVEGTCADTLGR